MEIININKSEKNEKYSVISFKFPNKKAIGKTSKKEYRVNEQKRKRANLGRNLQQQLERFSNTLLAKDFYLY
jgi:hypothetical protein